MMTLTTSPAEDVDHCEVQDFLKEAALFRWAGIGFERSEAFQITGALRRLASSEREVKMQRVRLWGKILGTEADYYIAEAFGDIVPDDPGDSMEFAPTEPSGAGVNKYNYYVTTNLCKDWVALPDLKPEDIVRARMIKKLMTGRLNAKVMTHPYFEGNEAVLLRVHIARITADTTLMVKGQMKPNEDDDGRPAVDPEFEFPPSEELLQLKAWAHKEPHILRSGRTTHAEPPDDDGGENPAVNMLREKMLAEREVDPVRDVIRGIEDDGLEWSVKEAGDCAHYLNHFAAEPAVPLPLRRSVSAVTYLRCFTWPGAVCARNDSHVINLYVGNGLPLAERPFYPPAPPNVEDECVDYEEEIEPQGTPEAEDEGEKAAEA
eukprot:NODE_4873_length_1835_cov_9.781616.p1 GENE.NODE_4873_length_1835_cov_9.781616~~NODE_4873_length_1835_cov_9.781616.p1  ORF type:complete len:376 (+),score=127.98 NODE_4873_length_1835_cov_9.781616:334-1461(+)